MINVTPTTKNERNPMSAKIIEGSDPAQNASKINKIPGRK